SAVMSDAVTSDTDGGRSHLPLRGSSGVAPDSLLPPGRPYRPGTFGTITVHLVGARTKHHHMSCRSRSIGGGVPLSVMSDIQLSLPESRVPDPGAAPALRWGILGPGGIADSFVAALRAHTRQAVVAVGSRSGDRAQVFA